MKDAAASALLTLGDGNWRMGEGAQVGKTKPAELDDKTIVEHYTCTFSSRLPATRLDVLSQTTS